MNNGKILTTIFLSRMSASTPTSVISLDVDENQDAHSATSSTSETFPHAGWSEYFIKIGENRNSLGMFYAKCKLCLGRKVISCSYGTSANIKRHIEVIHLFFP